LTSEDTIQVISATYGNAVQPRLDTNAPKALSYDSADTQIALWENSQNSVTLFRSPLSMSFELITLSKQLNGQAEAAIAEGVKQQRSRKGNRSLEKRKRRISRKPGKPI
jgi:hypothetical protein